MLSSTRMAVEKAFGLLKGRFRRIKFFTEYRHIDFISNVVVAACILHNYCINENDIDIDIDEYKDDDCINDIDDNINENVNNRNVMDR